MEAAFRGPPTSVRDISALHDMAGDRDAHCVDDGVPSAEAVDPWGMRVADGTMTPLPNMMPASWKEKARSVAQPITEESGIERRMATAFGLFLGLDDAGRSSYQSISAMFHLFDGWEATDEYERIDQ